MTPQSDDADDDDDDDDDDDGDSTEDVEVLGAVEMMVAKVVGDGAFALPSATLLTVSTLAIVPTFSFAEPVKSAPEPGGPPFGPEEGGAPVFGGLAGINGGDTGAEGAGRTLEGAGLPPGGPPGVDGEPPPHTSASEVE